MTISTILFDAGDVLYSKPRRKAVIADFLADRGCQIPASKDKLEREMRLAAHGGRISVDTFFGWLLARYGVENPQDLADGVALLKNLQSDVQFFEGVAETLHELKRRGLKLGIVTNTFNPPEEKNQWFKTIGIDGIWDSYADSCILKAVKPEPEIYLAALEPLGVAPQNAMFVGHAQYELDGAKALGMTTVRFNADADCFNADHTAIKFSDLLSLAPITEASPALVGTRFRPCAPICRRPG